jgi:hypothetical protein
MAHHNEQQRHIKRRSRINATHSRDLKKLSEFEHVHIKTLSLLDACTLGKFRWKGLLPAHFVCSVRRLYKQRHLLGGSQGYRRSFTTVVSGFEMKFHK